MCTMMTNNIISLLHMYVKSPNHEIHWVIRLFPISLDTKGVNKGLHYLDDFILVAGDSCTAEYQCDILLATFEKLKVPIEQSKLEGPST